MLMDLLCLDQCEIHSKIITDDVIMAQHQDHDY